MTRAPFNRNRLAEATSPYLLQHKDNPVHWQPWEAAVFDEARRRNVPVLLSIGYAACHWCHVMAHESFEDTEIAELMNAHFVCIKLDREERPDLDEIYMSALTMMGEQGGWPLTICLDADGAPFWGGTYFPKTPQYGRPGLMQILTEISRVWTDTPDKIAANTRALTKSLTAKAEADARGDMPADLPARAAQNLAEHIDLEKGGLTGAPKFPQPFLYAFLRQQAQLSDDARIKEAVRITAQKICQGGIYDHIGGGFARYSVDADWLVPHFEKMLYDNALMINLLCDVYRDSGEPLYAARIAETVDWLMRDMLTEGSAFAASLDADTEGEEGKFYVWEKREMDTVLGAAANDFCHTYGVTENGNFEGHTVLHLLPYDAPADNFAAARSALLAARATRTPPPRDDKILADWNAMMVTALVDAARLFDNDEWLGLAEAAYHDARKALSDTNGILRHTARQGKRLPLSLAADYGFWGLAATALYQATTSQDYLDDAMAYAADLHEKFHDAARGGYLSNERDQETLLVNNRAVHDNAQPSANATALQLFSSLAVLTGDMRWHEKAAQGFTALAGHLAQHYPSMTSLLSAHLHHKNPLCIIIIGDDARARAMEKTALTHEVCFAHILRFNDAADLPPEHPAAGKTKINGASAAYVCPGQICLPPLTDSDALSAALDAVLSERHSNIET